MQTCSIFACDTNRCNDRFNTDSTGRVCKNEQFNSSNIAVQHRFTNDSSLVFPPGMPRAPRARMSLHTTGWPICPALLHAGMSPVARTRVSCNLPSSPSCIIQSRWLRVACVCGACVRACVRACLRACMRTCVRACVRACVQGNEAISWGQSRRIVHTLGQCSYVRTNKCNGTVYGGECDLPQLHGYIQ